MARPESRMKMGYLPIDPHHYERILSLVKPAGDSSHRLLDPFAGDGAFLAAAASAWNMTPYANELDGERADACIARFGPTQAVRCDVERLTASLSAFSAAWLNPPYDHDRAAKNSKRVEFTYLRHAWKWLCEGGIGLWCIYQQHLTGEAAAFLAKNSRRVDVWRLPGLHQGEFEQIVVVAIKTAHQSDPDSLYQHILAQKAAPPLLEVQAEPCYTLPPMPTVKHFVFAPDLIDEVQGLRLVTEQGAWQMAGFQALLAVPLPPADLVPPVLPRPGHTALVLAAGIADGAVIPHTTYGQVALRGTTTTVEEIARVEEEITPGDPDHPIIKTTQRLRPTTTLTLLAQDGTVIEMRGDNALLDFIRTHRQPLTAHLNARFKPLYTFDMNGIGGLLGRMRLNGKYPLYTPQQHVIAAVTKALETKDKLLLIGAMGTGKTAMGSAATIAMMTGAVKGLRHKIREDQVTLIVAPPHLASKWKRELLSLYPQSYIAQLDRHRDVKTFMEKAALMGGHIPKIGLIKRDMTKLGSTRVPAVVWRTRALARWKPIDPTPNGCQPHERIVKERIPLCPVCSVPVVQRLKGGDHYATADWLTRGARRCDTCDSPLWQVARHRDTSRTSSALDGLRVRLDQYIQQHYRDRVFLLIWDEAHEAANGDRGNGEAFGRLAGVAKKVLAMTGTPFNGRASSLFNLEYHLNPRIRQAYPWGGAARLSRKVRGSKGFPHHLDSGAKRGAAESQWVSDMGVLEQVIEERPTYHPESGAYTGTATYERPYSEAPGIAPRLVAELIDHSLFFSLGDLSEALPPFEELALPVTPDADVAGLYAGTLESLKTYLVKRRWEGDASFLGAYFQWAMSWLNTPHLPYPIIHNCKDALTGRVRSHTVKHLDALTADRVYAKEQALLELVQSELDAGRPCVVYVRQTKTRDLQPRLASLITQHIPSARPFILRDTVSAERREATINKQVEAGINVLICSPDLVKTGLDLLFAPTLVFYEPTFNLSTMMQAAARAYRLNQKQACRVVYLFYTQTMEHHAVQLMSRKQRAAKLLNGEVGLSGLDSLTEGESGLEEALMKMIARHNEAPSQEDALLDPTDLFKREALNPLDADDAAFWQVATSAESDTPLLMVERDPLETIGVELGATIQPLQLTEDKPVSLLASASKNIPLHALPEANVVSQPETLLTRITARFTPVSRLPAERRVRVLERIIQALEQGVPNPSDTALKLCEGVMHPDFARYPVHTESLTRWLTKYLRVEKAMALEQIETFAAELVTLAQQPLAPKPGLQPKTTTKSPRRKPNLTAVPEDRPVVAQPPVQVIAGAVSATKPATAVKPSRRKREPSRQLALFSLAQPYA